VELYLHSPIHLCGMMLIHGVGFSWAQVQLYIIPFTFYYSFKLEISFWTLLQLFTSFLTWTIKNIMTILVGLFIFMLSILFSICGFASFEIVFRPCNCFLNYLTILWFLHFSQLISYIHWMECIKCVHNGEVLPVFMFHFQNCWLNFD